MRSEDRFILWRMSDCLAFCSTVSMSARLSPRLGTRIVTGPSRRSLSSSVTVAASAGSVGTSTSRGIADGAASS